MPLPSPEPELWNPDIEAMPLERLRQIQVEKFRKQLQYCRDRSDFFREKIRSIGLEPGDIRTFDDFHQVPPMFTPEELRASQDESSRTLGHPFGMHLCASLDEVVAVAATSGTTGFPTFYSFTRHDLAVTQEVVARAFRRAGIHPGDTVLHGTGLSMWAFGIPLVRALTANGIRVIPAGAEAGTERFLRFAQLTRPKAMTCTPSFALYLIEQAPKVAGIEVGDLGIKKIICNGEPGAGLAEVRKQLREAYQAEVYDSAGLPYGFLNISCNYEPYQGMHMISEDFAMYYELIDPDTKKPLPMTDGAIGEKMITPLDWEAAPPIKYAMRDLIQIHTSPCPCGAPGVRVKIIGRVDDMLIVKGVNVYPGALKNVVASFAPRTTGEMRIVLTERPPRVVPPLRLKVEHAAGLTDADKSTLIRDLEKRSADVLRVRPVVELVPPGSLPRSTHKAHYFEKAYED